MLLRSYLNLNKLFWIYFNSQSKWFGVATAKIQFIIPFTQYHLKTLRSDMLRIPSDNSVPRRERWKSSWKNRPKKAAMAEHCSGHSISLESTKLLRARGNLNNNRVLEAWEVNFCGLNVLNQDNDIHLHHE